MTTKQDEGIEMKIEMYLPYYTSEDGMVNAYLPEGRLHGAVWLACAKDLKLLKAAIERLPLFKNKEIVLTKREL